MVYAHSDQSLVLEWPSHNEDAEIRGVELEIRKSVGRFITGWLNYNYIKKSVSDLEIPNLSDIPIITDDPNIGRNGVQHQDGVCTVSIAIVERLGHAEHHDVEPFFGPGDVGSLIGNFPRFRLDICTVT